MLGSTFTLEAVEDTDEVTFGLIADEEMKEFTIQLVSPTPMTDEDVLASLRFLCEELSRQTADGQALFTDDDVAQYQ